MRGSTRASPGPMLQLAPRHPRSLALVLVLVGGCLRGSAPASGPAAGAGAGPAPPGTRDVDTPAGPASGPAPAAELTPAARSPPQTVRVTAIEHPGCFLLLDLETDTTLVAGDQPCDQRTIPASTFKVPHALIALDTGVVTDPEATETWDGTRYWIESWHRDHSLRTAIYFSVVWFFQRTARAIGPARMRDYLSAFHYGNAQVEAPIDGFWLRDGSLQISPEESLRFWADLYRDRLPRGAEHLPQLRAMLVRPPSSFRGRMPDGAAIPEGHPQMIFSAKTGTGSHGQGSVSWLLGHIECPDREHVFASRVLVDEPPERVSPAVVHGLAALGELGVLRCEAPWGG